MTALSYQAEGTHVLADLSGAAPALLADSKRLEVLLRDAAVAAGATILHSHFHAFGPGQGVTGVVLLAESHISIHTWPEQCFAAADIFMCGASQPELALAVMRAALAPAACEVRTVRRAAQRLAGDGVLSTEVGIAL
ncbi:adenosylmethionine decarboxylase [Pseudoduganella plicata]|uniref:S-adenosylmethionine decarboxylase proenzyme n=1 Tax=Pseudoduganella plicata TaxID=321984 RepID=A0A4P7BFE2_9BURK|nr:adenosylmethionine decarboxylase [Pseudoduganella plicata]QBQ37466.1 adenosylmethionine decarboxylase [Pseudoduganella plicata]GGY90407.1 S-adenosylmethionine decarboxylase proenzyme [Pseudoduganella plicata]